MKAARSKIGHTSAALLRSGGATAIKARQVLLDVANERAALLAALMELRAEINEREFNAIAGFVVLSASSQSLRVLTRVDAVLIKVQS
jgi:hypothetical protein